MRLLQKSYWTTRRILTLIAGIIFVVLVTLNFEIVADALHQLANANLYIFLLVPTSFALSYFCIANYYVSFFRSFEKKVSLKKVYELVFALNFVNQILPSGGLSGTTYFIYGIDKSRKKIPAGLATLSHFGRYIFAYISYFFVLGVAFIFLKLGDDPLTKKFLHEGFRLFGINLTGSSLITVLVISSFILITGVWYVISSEKRVDNFIGSIGRFIDWVVKKFRKNKPLFGKATIKKTISDFHKSYVKLRKNSQHLIKPFMFMLVSTAFEVLVVYFSYLAVGASINPGIIMVAFAIANVAGVISVIPGDVGVHETVMVVMLALAGVDKGVALSGTLLYRVLAKYFFTAIGFYFYNQILKPVKQKRA